MSTVFLAFAFIFAIFACAGWPTVNRVHFGWLSLVMFYASLLFGSVGHLFR
jgi:hypothetical protein